MDINFNNSTATDSGNLKFSGVSSGIDSQAIIDSIIGAKRIQITQIEEKIQVNDDKVSAFNQLQTLSQNFAETLDGLRGSTSILGGDVFDSKIAFPTSQASATAPVGHAVSQAGEILGVNVTDKAVAGTYKVEVRQVASAQQIRSDAINGALSDDMSTLGLATGAMSINGEDVIISGSDTLLDVRDKINGTNTGQNPSGVNASVISVSDTEHYLVISSTETGVANNITFGGDQVVHNGLGLTSVGTDTVKNEIQSAQDAIIRVNDLGVDIVRSSNTIDDVIGGVTIDLFKAEPDTEIVIDVEHDLNAVKTSIVDFVTAYNDLKSFIEDQQREIVREDGGDAEYGVLAFDSTLKQIENKMSEIITNEVPGLESGFASLGQIGIDVNREFMLEIDEAEFDNVLLQNLDEVRRLFAFDFSSSDSRVTVVGVGTDSEYNVDVNGDPLPYYLNIGGTDANGVVTSANISETQGAGSGGADDGSILASGNALTASGASNADGLKLFFNGGANLGPVDDIEVTFTRGVADQLYDFFNDISKTGGDLDDVKSNLSAANNDYTQDITKIESRLDLQRATLEAKFLAMETAMYQINALKDSLSQQIDAMTADG